MVEPTTDGTLAADRLLVAILATSPLRHRLAAAVDLF
jgi:hypothetical protein